MRGIGPIGSTKVALAVSAAAAVALLAIVPAFACTPTTTTSIRPARGDVGSVAEVSGSLFKPDMGAVVVKWGGASGVVLATAPVNADGSFGPVPVTVPANAEQGRTAILAAYQPADPSARVSNMTFVVNGPPVHVAPAPQPIADPSPSQETAVAVPPSAAPVAGPAPSSAPAPARTPAAATPGVARVQQQLEAVPPAPAPAPPVVKESTAVAPAPVAAPQPATPLAGVGSTGVPEYPEPAAVQVPAPEPADSTVEDGSSAGAPVALIAIGLTLLAAGAGFAVHRLRRRQTVDAQ
jgi:hypothetical protein